jgi:hypothetical protein
MYRLALTLALFASACSAALPAPPPPPTGPLAVAINIHGGRDLHAENGVVYWHELSAGESYQGAIYRTPIGGGEFGVLVDKGAYGDVAYDGGNAYYWVDDPAGKAIDLMRIPLSGGTPTKISVVPLVGFWGGTPIGAGKAFLMAEGQMVLDILAVPLAGGDPQPFASQNDGGDWNTSTKIIPTFAVDDNDLYWFAPSPHYRDFMMPPSETGGALLRAPFSGGPGKRFAQIPDASTFDAIAADKTGVYYSFTPYPSGGERGINHVDAAGNTTPVVSGAGTKQMLAKDGTLYWLQADTAPYGVMASRDGQTTLIAADPKPPQYLTLDEHNVYYVDADTIWQAALP